MRTGNGETEGTDGASFQELAHWVVQTIVRRCREARPGPGELGKFAELDLLHTDMQISMP